MRLSRAVRVAVAVALTAYVLWKADPGRVAAAMSGADAGWIVAAVALVLVDRSLMAQRWIALVTALAAARPSLRDLLRVFFVSTFVGSFVPSVGGDVYRAYSLSRLGVGGAEAAASVLMDRALGVLSIVAVGAAAALMLDRDAATGGILLILIGATAVCAGVAAAVFSERASNASRMLVARLPHPKLRDTGARLVEAIRRYAGHRPTLYGVLTASLAVQALRVVQAWCLGRSLDLAVPLSAYFVYIPVILLVMLLPVTVSGLGTGQLAFESLFARGGVGAPDAFALSVLFIALGFVGNLPGAAYYAFGSEQRPQPTG